MHSPHTLLTQVIQLAETSGDTGTTDGSSSSSSNDSSNKGIHTNATTTGTSNTTDGEDKEHSHRGRKRDVQIKWDAGWTAWVSVDPHTWVLMEDMETSTRVTRC